MRVEDRLGLRERLSFGGMAAVCLGTDEGMRINLERVTKNYGSLTALEEVTAEIDSEQVVALLGPNGAGKTTLLRCMSGVISPSAGGVVYDGLEFNRGMMELRKRMFFLPDVPFVFEEWSILRHMGMVLRLYETSLEGI